MGRLQGIWTYIEITVEVCPSVEHVTQAAVAESTQGSTVHLVRLNLCLQFSSALSGI